MWQTTRISEKRCESVDKVFQKLINCGKSKGSYGQYKYPAVKYVRKQRQLKKVRTKKVFTAKNV